LWFDNAGKTGMSDLHGFLDFQTGSFRDIPCIPWCRMPHEAEIYNALTRNLKPAFATTVQEATSRFSINCVPTPSNRAK
jgi:hypothetical protein